MISVSSLCGRSQSSFIFRLLRSVRFSLLGDVANIKICSAHDFANDLFSLDNHFVYNGGNLEELVSACIVLSSLDSFDHLEPSRC